MSGVHVYMSFYTCQDDGLLPRRSLDVFHAVCFWGSCEAATFNKHSLPLSKPLSQTNSMIKRHTWGDPRGNLHPRLSFCATLFIHFSLSYVFYVLGFSFGSEWREYFAEDTSFFPLMRLQRILCDIVSRQFTALVCEAFHFPRPGDLAPFHLPPTVRTFVYLLKFHSCSQLNILASQHRALLGREIPVCSGQCSYFSRLTGWLHLYSTR